MKCQSIELLEIKGGSQQLILSQKVLKIRPDAATIKQNLKKLLDEGVNDTDIILDTIQNCGGTKTVWKLARRSKSQRQKKKQSP
jgi:hypothetical protein